MLTIVKQYKQRVIIAWSAEVKASIHQGDELLDAEICFISKLHVSWMLKSGLVHFVRMNDILIAVDETLSRKTQANAAAFSFDPFPCTFCRYAEQDKRRRTNYPCQICRLQGRCSVTDVLAGDQIVRTGCAIEIEVRHDGTQPSLMRESLRNESASDLE